MDENMNQLAEQAPETGDAFLDAWDGDAESTANPPEDAAEPMDGSGEETAAGADESAETPESGTETPAEVEMPAEVQQPRQAAENAPPRLFELRHLGEVRQVNEADMVTLAQKGMDYDRIRSQYDEMKPVMELFNRFANQQGVSTKSYIDQLRAQAKQAEGLSEADARRTVELEDREAAIAAAEAERQAAADAAAQDREAAQAAESRRQADIAEFQQTFPETAKDPGSIPQQVWDEVRGGASLVAAYARYAVRSAQQAAAEAKRETASVQQNQRNAERSTGSMRSAGDGAKPDAFADAFDTAL